MSDEHSSAIGRRALLGGLLASLPAGASALEVLRSDRPRPRGAIAPARPQAPAGRSVVAGSGIGAVTGFVVRDLETGRTLAEHQPYLALPPASVAKAVTALYALDALGAGYRFETRVMVTGPVANGRVQGDLYLVGGGDPTLDTDRLAELARAVTAAGIFGVSGNAYVVAEGLPYHAAIDPGQPEHVGYNPSISGLNLNFNRVHFAWARAAQGYSLAMTAPGARFNPPVAGIGMRVAERSAPVFAYRSIEGQDDWSVASGALGKAGSRWLPVRHPAEYAAEVFRALGAGFNLRLPGFRVADAAPRGQVVATVQSVPLERVVRDMLKYSTNLTAEVAGLRASQARGGAPRTVADSGALMTDWLAGGYGVSRARFLNHSGLTDVTRMTADEMVQVLDIAAATTPLPGLLKEIPLLDARGKAAPVAGVGVRAKTGTLNFTRALAGYITGRSGRKLAFAIFAADIDARAAIAGANPERPEGAATWLGAARRQERALLRAWAEAYAG